jgi:hypothetical protein
MADEHLPTPPGSTIAEIAHDLRLLRLQVENIAARLAAQDQRFDARSAGIEQSTHNLIGEVARGFGQQQQQLSRVEQRFDAVDAGLTAIREGLLGNQRMLIELVGRKG